MDNRERVDRQAILDAALAEMVARGIDEFTVAGVAARAGGRS
jgi:AcrR family transcriptional regulator